jgi:hypothetical protein
MTETTIELKIVGPLNRVITGIVYVLSVFKIYNQKLMSVPRVKAVAEMSVRLTTSSAGISQLLSASLVAALKRGGKRVSERRER